MSVYQRTGSDTTIYSYYLPQTYQVKVAGKAAAEKAAAEKVAAEKAAAQKAAAEKAADDAKVVILENCRLRLDVSNMSAILE